MAGGPRPDVTLLLERVRAGDERARSDLIARVYGELRKVAASLMRRERSDHTLPPTALVHEAMVRLMGGQALGEAPDRNYFFAAAARAMRQVLVDHARRRATRRHGGAHRRVPLDLVVDHFEAQKLDVLAVHDAIERLAALHERQSQVVTLRYFGGLTMPEIAAALDISLATAENDWRIARAWLKAQLREGDEG
jgi:RNA polymerase sigma factor (TIGR02999 family)